MTNDQQKTVGADYSGGLPMAWSVMLCFNVPRLFFRIVESDRFYCKCGYRFSTVEEVEILNLAVIKRDGHREPYSREKMELGLRKAFEKRPLTGESFKRLVGQIERDIQLKGRTEITSHQVGEIIMKRLQRVDQVAYIRFASVYRQFQDVESFKQELNRLLKSRRSPARRKSTNT